ncbi:MAG: methyltransferase [Myxococcota bacterium]|nr:methyltransferase [Myxococcota bacterium]
MDLVEFVDAEGRKRVAKIRQDAAEAVGRDHGVVHTPPAVARWLVEAVDARLRQYLRVTDGLSDPRVHLLDPACGPGVFVAAALERTPPARRLTAIDVDPAALDATREPLLRAARRVGACLHLRTADTLSLEPRLDSPVAVVVGNPPWSARSPNRGDTLIEALLDDVRREPDGRPLNERKRGVLSESCIRFMRWCVEVVRRAPAGGVLGLVTNGSWLDGPVQRGLRAALLRWLDGIDVVDLGGNAMLSRPRGAPRDENVFGVRPSAALLLGWRRPHGEERPGRAAVQFARLCGSRADKLAALQSGSVVLEPVRPVQPALRIERPVVPMNRDLRASWERALPLDSIFPFHAEGLQTNRDRVCIDDRLDRLIERLHRLARGDHDEAFAAGLRARPHFQPEAARRTLAAALERDPEGRHGLVARRVAYRPLQARWVCIVAPLCHRPRPALLAASAFGPMLLTVRKDRGDRPWNLVAASSLPPDSSYLSARSSCRTRAFPAFGPNGRANVSERARCAFEACLGEPISPVRLVEYAAGLLSAQAYRRAFAPWLRSDYPRLLPPPSAPAFERIADAGIALRTALDGGPDDGPPCAVGHFTVRSHALASALADADRAVREAFPALDRAAAWGPQPASLHGENPGFDDGEPL